MPPAAAALVETGLLVIFPVRTAAVEVAVDAAAAASWFYNLPRSCDDGL
jgi:hypothetical protein